MLSRAKSGKFVLQLPMDRTVLLNCAELFGGAEIAGLVAHCRTGQCLTQSCTRSWGTFSRR